MRFFRIITPLSLLNILALYVIIAGGIEGGWSILGVVVGLPVLFVGVISDIGLRELCKKQPAKLWLYESLLIVVGYFIFKNYFMR